MARFFPLTLPSPPASGGEEIEFTLSFVVEIRTFGSCNFLNDLAHFAQGERSQGLRFDVLPGAQREHGGGRGLVIGSVEDDEAIVAPQAPVLLLDVDAVLL